jgi:hypothetical protein
LKSISLELLHQYAGRWVVWNRQEDRILGSGRTFEEAKQVAAALGESSVVLAEAPSETGWRGRKPHWLCVVAVFISLTQPMGAPQSASALERQESAASQSLDEDDAADNSAEQVEGWKRPR